MKNLKQLLIPFFILTSFYGCAQQPKNNLAETEMKVEKKTSTKSHSFGGWYCPDNLFGFPAVNYSNWSQVPVVTDRLPTKQETQTEASLIFIDTSLYPDAKVIDIKLPALAKHFNYNTHREEYIIIIQAVSIVGDSIVGFRYLNGGNGSARLSEVEIIKDFGTNDLKECKFVSIDIEIKASEENIWKVLTDKSYNANLAPIFNLDNSLPKDWRATTNFNYFYAKSGGNLASFADKHFGVFYLQNDYKSNNYTEKILLVKSKEKEGFYTIKLAFGPFYTDYEQQKKQLTQWMEKVQYLSESEIELVKFKK